jgi:hypothetical protein
MPHSADSSAEGSDLLTLSTQASTTNEFPSVRTTFSLPDRDSQHDSPAVTGFTFTDPEPAELPSVPSPTGIQFNLDSFPLAVTPSAQFVDNSAKMATTEASKRRTQYYEDSFAYKDGHVQSAKERIQKDSPVVVELKTNVIVGFSGANISSRTTHNVIGQGRIHRSHEPLPAPFRTLSPARSGYHD